MARKRNPWKGDDAKSDMTPMIDVTFQLIIFFMCVTETANLAKDKNLKLPVASKAEEDQSEPGRLMINIRKDGAIYIMGQQYTPNSLDDVLKSERVKSWDAKENAPTRAIIFRIDQETQFYHVSEVMKQCMNHKLWKLMFATKDPTSAN